MARRMGASSRITSMPTLGSVGAIPMRRRIRFSFCVRARKASPIQIRKLPRPKSMVRSTEGGIFVLSMRIFRPGLRSTMP